MANPIRLPLSPRQAEALSTLLEYWPGGLRWDRLLTDPDVVQALREVAEKLSTLRSEQ